MPALDWIWKNRWFFLIVVVPVVLVTIFETFISSDIYVSESRFVIKAPAQKQAQVSTLASLIQTAGISGGQEQGYEVMDYIRSRSALADLGGQAEVGRIFSREGVDLISRYPGVFQGSTNERLFRYYRRMVSASMDQETGVVVLDAHAFTPADAQHLNQRLLELSENLVNELNVRAQGKQIAEAEKRVAEAEARAKRARSVLGAFRNSQELLDPAKQASSVLDVSNKLIAEQVALKAQLEQMRVATPRNPAIPAIEARLTAMARAIDAQNGRAVGTRSGIASKLPGYENLAQEQEFAAANLNVANAALVQARSEAVRQQYYLERVVRPSLPDEPALPRRLRIILTVLGVSLCLYFVAWMLVIGVLEHSSEA